MASSSLFRLISKSSRFWNCRREITTSASRISSSPWLILPPSNGGDKLDMNFYSLAHNKVGSIKGGYSGFAVDDANHHTMLVGSSNGWLAMAHRRPDEASPELFLWNPVSRRRINLPPLPSDMKFKSTSGIRKVIVCSAGGGEEEWRVVMSYGRECRLAFCSLGGVSDAAGGWFPNFGIDDWYVESHRDSAYSIKQNRLFCITKRGDLERWNLDKLEIDGSNAVREEIVAPPYDATANTVEYYVVVAEHSNEVFVVARNIRLNDDSVCSSNKTVSFDVFKINDDGAGNLRMRPSSLDGLVVFVGMNHSFALPAAEFPELQTDSIYFTDHMEFSEGAHRCFGIQDLGIYDYESKSFSSCYYPNDAPPITRIVSPSPPFWFTPTCH